MRLGGVWFRVYAVGIRLQGLGFRVGSEVEDQTLSHCRFVFASTSPKSQACLPCLRGVGLLGYSRVLFLLNSSLKLHALSLQGIDEDSPLLIDINNAIQARIGAPECLLARAKGSR